MENYLKGMIYEDQSLNNIISKGHKRAYKWNSIPMNECIASGIFKNYSEKLQFRRDSKLAEKEEEEKKEIKEIQEKNEARNECNEVNANIDTGCDILYYNEDTKEWTIVQCKNYTHNVPLHK